MLDGIKINFAFVLSGLRKLLRNIKVITVLIFKLVGD